MQPVPTLMILPPYFEGPADDDGLFEFYREIDAAIGIDIIGYNIPQATGISVSLDLLKRLIELRNFNYIKDSAGDLTVHQEYFQVTSGVLNGAGHDHRFLLDGGHQGRDLGRRKLHAGTKPWQLYELADDEEVHRGTGSLGSICIRSLLMIWRGKYTPSVVRASQASWLWHRQRAQAASQAHCR